MTDTLNEHYRAHLHMRHPETPFYQSGLDVPRDAVRARIRRERGSHTGIGEKTALRELEANNANQAMLEEIARLTSLEYLDLGGPVTATDLAPLRALCNLRHLKIDSLRNIADFTPILDLVQLDALFLSSVKHLTDLDWLRPMKDRLIALGIEGGMWNKQTIESLAPLEGFGLEGLFLTSTVLLDQDLSPIATMPKIRYLGTGINAPREQFFALRDSKPELECSWFDPRAWSNFNDPKRPKKTN